MGSSDALLEVMLMLNVESVLDDGGKGGRHIK